MSSSSLGNAEYEQEIMGIRASQELMNKVIILLVYKKQKNINSRK